MQAVRAGFCRITCSLFMWLKQTLDPMTRAPLLPTICPTQGQQQMHPEADEDVMERAFNTEEEEYLHSLFCEIDTNGDGMLV